MQLMKRRHYFNLIELLVSFSILLLLITLLSPSLKRMVVFSHETKCLSQVKNISVGLNLYTEDHTGYMPISVQGPPHPWVSMKWAYELSSYLSLEFETLESFSSRDNVFECPSHNFDEYGLSVPDRVGGYGHNWRYMGYIEKEPGSAHHNAPNLHRQTILRANKPSESFYIGDSMDFTDQSLQMVTRYTNHFQQLSFVYRPSPWGRAGYLYEYRRHREGGNYLWLDGHATYMLYDELKLGKNNNPFYFWELEKN